MKKVCILIFVLYCMGGNTHLSDSQERDNVYERWFTEPVECIYFVWQNGERFKFTTHEWNMVSGDPEEKLQEMASHGYDIKTCWFVIHNHIVPAEFSNNDRALYRLLVRRGFRGAFKLYTSRGVFMLRDK